MTRQACWLLPLLMMACASGATRTTVRVSTATHHVATDVRTTLPTWLQAAPVQTRVLRGSDGNTYLGLWVDTPDVATAIERPPLDVALVIDVSGSMSGSKIEHARSAASSFLETLADGDRVSVYAFNDRVTELCAPTVLRAATRVELIHRVRQLYASGGTNLHDGLLAGHLATEHAPPSHPVRRIVMISDGRATVGDVDTESIANVAARATEHGAQVTAIGVGLDYDEGTLGAMAVRSAGRLYHLEEPTQMASILDQELQLLGRTVAANAYIEFAPAEGVVIEATEATRVDRRGATVRIPLGSLYARQHREVLLRARIPTTGEGTRSFGTARLVWNDPAAANEQRQSGDLTLAYELTSDDAAARASITERVQAMVLSREVAQAQVHASQLLNQGEAERATRELEAAEVRIQQAQMSFIDESVRGSLQRQAEGIARGRSAASSAASAPAAARPARARAAALQNNNSAMDAYGY